jgi:hypothetical protein
MVKGISVRKSLLRRRGVFTQVRRADEVDWNLAVFKELQWKRCTQWFVEVTMTFCLLRVAYCVPCSCAVIVKEKTATSDGRRPGLRMSKWLESHHRSLLAQCRLLQ